MDEAESFPAKMEYSTPHANVYGGSVGAIGKKNKVTMVVPRRALAWPVVVGSPPPVASAFQPRATIVEQISRADGAVVLQQASGQVLSGTGGVGKTQIAASVFFSSTEGLRVWVTAESRESVITGFAEAAVSLDLAHPSVGNERLAQFFLGFLSSTAQTWLVVLDNVNDATDLAGLWPPTKGHVIVTTRRRDAAISGAGRTIIDVGVYTEPEASNYLQERLTPWLAQLPQDALTDSGRMAEDLGRLPLALAQAAAVIINDGITCVQYRAKFADHAQSIDELFPPDADADGYARTVATTWELAIEAAENIKPPGLARPMATIVALLDPAGIPETILTSQPVCTWLTTAAQSQVTPATARKALRSLYQLSLIEHDPNLDNPRAVRMHNLTARAIQQTLPPQRTDVAGASVADGILSIWPEVENTPPLSESLRTNTAALVKAAPNGLWNTPAAGMHAVLFRAGRSLLDAGQVGSAIEYHQKLHNEARQYLGPDRLETLASGSNLASSYRHAGRVYEAIALSKQVITEQTRVLGPDHPNTLGTRNNLAFAYQSSGRADEAIVLFEQVLTDSTRTLGPDHPNTLTTQNNLATAYQVAGRVDEAIVLHEQVLTDRTLVLGPNDPKIMGSQNNLANALQSAGRVDEAIVIYEQVLTKQTRALGPDHPNTMGSQNNLASAYQDAGRVDEAIVIYEQALTTQTRVLGPDHPDTLGSQNNLAGAYESAGRVDEAIVTYEQALTLLPRVLGPDHPNTITTRKNLAYARKHRLR